MVILNTLEELILTTKYIRRITIHCVVFTTTIKCIDVIISNVLEEEQFTFKLIEKKNKGDFTPNFPTDSVISPILKLKKGALIIINKKSEKRWDVYFDHTCTVVVN